MKIGAIADDFTGATDLASTLVKGGMRTTQFIGVPASSTADDCDAGVVALKSRTISPRDAVDQSLTALRWLQASGAQQIIFKYCSTFDSTPEGNIGPVADALLEALGEEIAIVCPAFPTNKRTIYKGYLFVGDDLLSESSMRDHPLTPMTDANLMRVMTAQSRHSAGLLDLDTVRAGPASIRDRMAKLRADGHRYAVLDALEDQDLMIAGKALSDAKLITGGSGIALGLPANFGGGAQDQTSIERAPGRLAVLAGSCSVATRAQIAHALSHGIPSTALDPIAISADSQAVHKATDWASSQLSDERPILIYSSADPEDVAQIQSELGREAAGDLVEQAFADIARELIGSGVRNLLVAGGETSGAVTEALGIDRLEIGPEIDPGVPWTRAKTGTGIDITLALKSGNFGTEDFFTKAFDRLS